MNIRRRRMNILLAICILLASSPYGATRGADWPRFRGPRLDGISRESLDAETVAGEGLTMLWQANVGLGYSSVTVVGDRAYTAGNFDGRDVIRCLNVVDGETIWEHSYPADVWPYLYSGGTNSTPLVAGEAAYFVGRHGEVLRLSAADGTVEWEKNLHADLGMKKPEWGFTSCPLLIGDKLLLNAGSAGAALSADDGSVVWSTGKEGAGYATPVPAQVDGRGVVLIFTPDALACVTIEEGDVLWKHPWPTNYGVNAAEPIMIADDLAFISSAYGFGCALLRFDADGAEEVWRHKKMQNHFDACIRRGDYLYGIHGDGGDKTFLKCLRIEDGEVFWSDMRGLGTGGLLGASNALIVLNEAGELTLVAYNPTKFEELASYSIDALAPNPDAEGRPAVCWTPPTLANGRLYCRNSAGVLVCLKAPE